MNYSVAIRTLGTNPNLLKKEIESIYLQSIQPDKVVIYIANGYNRPLFQVANEEYVSVHKGMVSQRALRYDEIDSECILLLDDDVELSSNSVEKMLKAMYENDADCVGADVFETYKLPVKSKVYAMLSNLVFPHFDSSWADKVRLTGSFSYNNCPRKSVLPTQCVGGPCALWRKKAILRIRWEDEKWMDKLAGFPFGEDMVESYKLYVNGGRLMMIFDAQVKNLNGQSSSAAYHSNVNKFYVRSLMTFCNWWRIIYETHTGFYRKLKCVGAFIIKLLWLLLVNAVAGIVLLSFKVPVNYIKGVRDGWRFTHSEQYNKIPKYILDK